MEFAERVMHSWKFVVIESDCLDLIERWNLQKEMPRDADLMFENVRALQCRFGVISPAEVSVGVCSDSVSWP
ncbi:hypothetical protein TorRG33x02_265280 [Trema orientale]|uniref:RNase H type-1 domain-containing protein n=1 Tax=Trema orientale TaxID=63057 RepID=A0A2P5D1J9_TREOI|nr:hypothetical protein TorRG33x02_265280 [Trema orientale]